MSGIYLIFCNYALSTFYIFLSYVWLFLPCFVWLCLYHLLNIGVSSGSVLKSLYFPFSMDSKGNLVYPHGCKCHFMTVVLNYSARSDLATYIQCLFNISTFISYSYLYLIFSKMRNLIYAFSSVLPSTIFVFLSDHSSLLHTPANYY